MAKIQTVLYSMPRGDSRSLPLAIPLSIYSTGANILFGLKLTADADVTDSNAYAKKTLTDANITSTTATQVNYLLNLTPNDTTGIPPGTYFAELEFVNAIAQSTPAAAGAVVISYPDPSIMLWKFQITADINRRL